jgi:hypothetical protein
LHIRDFSLIYTSMSDLRTNLLVAAQLYAQTHNKELATVSNKVAGYGTFFKRLGEGGGLTIRTYEKARIWFSENGIDVDALKENQEALNA